MITADQAIATAQKWEAEKAAGPSALVGRALLAHINSPASPQVTDEQIWRAALKAAAAFIEREFEEAPYNDGLPVVPCNALVEGILALSAPPAAETPIAIAATPATPEMICAVWDVFSGEEWFMTVTSPVTWDAKGVHDSLVQQGYAEHLQVMQRHVLCDGNPVVGLVQEVNRLRAAAPQEAKTVAAEISADCYFVYDPQGNYLETFSTSEQRDKAAEDAIANYLDDGWDVEVENVVCGIVTHVCKQFDVRKRPADGTPEYDEWPDHNYDELCNYGMFSVASAAQEQAPADKDAIRNAALDEAIEVCLRANPDKRMVAAIGISGHYATCANAIRALQSQPQQVTG